MNVNTKWIVVLIGLPLLLFMVFFLMISYGNTNGSESEKLLAENKQLKDELVKLEKQTTAENTKNSILNVHDSFVEATFEISSVSQRNEQMRPFVSKDSIEKLGLDTDIPETASIQSEVLSSRNYFRNISEEKNEVLSRVSIRYDSNDKLDKNLIFSVEYSKEAENEWKVTNIRYAEDFENN